MLDDWENLMTIIDNIADSNDTSKLLLIEKLNNSISLTLMFFRMRERVMGKLINTIEIVVPSATPRMPQNLTRIKLKVRLQAATTIKIHNIGRTIPFAVSEPEPTSNVILNNQKKSNT